MNPCKMLDEDGVCTIYDDRPLICRKYNLSKCDQTIGDYGYDEEFNTPEELMVYARKDLGEDEFDYQRAKHRAKLGGETEKAAFAAVKRARRKSRKSKVMTQC